jgi:hypothetical protein
MIIIAGLFLLCLYGIVRLIGSKGKLDSDAWIDLPVFKDIFKR